MLIVFDDTIADMECNRKLNPIVTELSLRGRKLNISLVFIWQSYFKVPKTIRLNATHYFIIKTANVIELQQIVSDNSPHIEFKDLKGLKVILKNHMAKMTITEKIKTVDNKIAQSKSQFDLAQNISWDFSFIIRKCC